MDLKTTADRLRSRTAAAVSGAVLEIIPGMGHALPPPLWERIIDRIAAHAV